MASQLPTENPSIQKFHKAGESGTRTNAGNFAEQSATVAWLEKSTRDPQFVEQLRKFAQHHPTLASASKLAPRLFFASVARALRDGLIWYESDPTQNQKGGGQAGGGGAGGGGGAASSSSNAASSSGTGGKAGSKPPKTPSAAPSSLMFDPRAPEPEAEPLETPPSVPGRATDGMTH